MSAASTLNLKEEMASSDEKFIERVAVPEDGHSAAERKSITRRILWKLDTR